MSAALNDDEKKYLVHTTLTKLLIQKLNETSAIINEYQYFYTNLVGPSKSTGSPNMGDDSYTLQFLKFQLIRIYLEIQESYSEFLKDDKLSEEDLHQIHFTEPAPEKSFFKEAEKMQMKSTVATLIKKPVLKPFTPLKNDVRPEKKGILSHNTIIKNPDRFARFEEELHDHELIDSNFNFLNRHTQKQELSAIYQTLIKKGYFKKRDIQNLKDIKHLDIRKFLDHRYNADLDKQFRIWENDPDGLANYVQDRYWIDKLPTC